MDARGTESLPSKPTIYYGRILLGEIGPLLAAMKKTTSRWSSHHTENDKDPLIQKLKDLQSRIIHLEPNEHLEPNVFLEPFLAIIRSGNNTGPVTKRALAAINRILCYGLISADDKNAVAAVESIADTVTHARFVGSDPGSDEVVLWEILTVLHTLILGPVGYLLTNESVCEIFNSSFRICFETRLSELLRTCTEDTLHHMVQLLFARLPQFKDEPVNSQQSRRLKMHTGNGSDVKDSKSRKRFGKESVSLSSSYTPPEHEEPEGICPPPVTDNSEDSLSTNLNSSSIETTTEPIKIDSPSVDSGINEIESETLDISQTHLAPDASSNQEDSIESAVESPEVVETVDKLDTSNEDQVVDTQQQPQQDTQTTIDGIITTEIDNNKNEFTNKLGVTFTPDDVAPEDAIPTPYGLPCIREVFRFLISLTASSNENNTQAMMMTALNLLTVALEVASEHISKAPSLISLVKDQLCRNLFQLLKSDAKIPVFLASLRACTLLFESLRNHLKFQLEMFIGKLIDIISSDSSAAYNHKELSLETIILLLRFPGLVEELFMNFDCNLYSSDAFEEIIKILSKNAFPLHGLYSTNLLCLEGFITLTNIIESHSTHSLDKSRGAESKEITSDSKEIPAVITPSYSGFFLGASLLGGYAPITPNLKARPILRGSKSLLREELLILKEKKRLITAGTDHFNTKPEKGIQYLQNNGIIGTSIEDIAVFLKENSHLDKQVLGEYISKKKNVDILSAFVKSFDFYGLRIDECLRSFLETFRLPGEAPLISIIIEHFSSHWHMSKGFPFSKDDSAFTLAYAIIMLNVDQHNQNAKKQNIPMTLDQFRFNLRGVNNGSDFDPKMLEEIYTAIRNEEIVMPAEHTGAVKENYLWKMLLKRGKTKQGEYLLSTGDYIFDRDIFSLCGRPAIASLSYLFDKSVEDRLSAKAILGFQKCASISARFGMSDIFDILIVTLCKFTTLTNSAEPYEQASVSFGTNEKAQLATQTLFNLVINYGDILCEGWKNIIELLLLLFKRRLLPASLIESEDFVEPSGKVCLLKEDNFHIPRVESGIFSSLYSYIALGDGASPRGLSPEDLEYVGKAKACILSCHPEKILSESAFLRYDSLNELLKAMIGASSIDNMMEFGTLPTNSSNIKTPQTPQDEIDENSQAFLLELLVSVFVANKDRAGGIWPRVRDQIYSILMGAVATEQHFLLERCVVVILRVAKVLLRRRELSKLILQSLRMLLLLKPQTLHKVSLQIVAGIHEILSLNADHIHRREDWAIIYTLLECAGAGAKPPPIVGPEQQDDSVTNSVQISTTWSSCTEPENINSSEIEHAQELHSTDEGHCNSASATTSASSESETAEATEPKPSQSKSAVEPSQNTGGWILVGREGEIEPVPAKRPISVNEWDIVHRRVLGDHHPEALIKAVDTFSFLVRDGHITAASLSPSVQACRTFVEATLNGGKLEKVILKSPVKSPGKRRGVSGRKKGEKQPKRPTSPATTSASAYDADESDSDDMPLSYQQASEKLLDLMDTLHTTSSCILELKTAEEKAMWNADSLWQMALCPLLQGIARYCCDIRPPIRSLAMTYLQRALLNHDLQTLNAIEWEGCFNKVLFPLLAKLLQPMPANNHGVLEETRLRAATLVQKVYLRHLATLLSLPTFTALWLTILDFMDKYLNTHRSDHLSDAVPEILKNMLLVMETTQVFHTSEGFTHLWSITWDRIDAFLPEFRHELFKTHPPSEIHKSELASGENSPPTAPKDDTSTHPQTKEVPDSKNVVTKPTDEDVPDEQKTPISASKDSTTLRLSLNQEFSLPSIESNVILQPPLPHLYPLSPSSPPSELQDGGQSTLLPPAMPHPQELSSALSLATISPYVPLPVTVLVTPSSSGVISPLSMSPTAANYASYVNQTATSCSPYSDHSIQQESSIVQQNYETDVNSTDFSTKSPIHSTDFSTKSPILGTDFSTKSPILGTDFSTKSPILSTDFTTKPPILDPEIGLCFHQNDSYNQGSELKSCGFALDSVTLSSENRTCSTYSENIKTASYPEILQSQPYSQQGFISSSPPSILNYSNPTTTPYAYSTTSVPQIPTEGISDSSPLQFTPKSQSSFVSQEIPSHLQFPPNTT